MKILGIETSCDETAAAVVEDGRRLLSNVVASSLDLQVPYGGVVPEIAARAQMEYILPVINQALVDAAVSPESRAKSNKPKKLSALSSQLSAQFDPWDQIDGIAVTQGPGLGGSLLVGVLTARALAIVHKKPIYGINHVEAHVYANFITKSSTPSYQLPATEPKFPILALIVSGGHTQLVLFKDHFKYKLLGQTHDDAVGEAFDKVAKIIGLPYPGGPSVAIAAQNGDSKAFKLPKAKMPGKYDFSFSGLKTAVLRVAQDAIGEKFDYPSANIPKRLKPRSQADIAASFQRVAIETLVDKILLAYQEFKPKSAVIAGGVAASAELRKQLSERLPVAIQYPDIRLCTDNAAMIATLGCYKMAAKQKPANPYKLDIAPNLSM